VTSTEVNLSRQHEGTEKFQPNDLSRVIVRASVGLSYLFDKITPVGLQAKIDERFKKPSIRLSKNKIFELPAFDAVRASTNIMVSAVLIAFGTANKLPLSTTYVTFMVAMGTSLSDRAWDRESAVYRISGVLNVIGGWFVTALTAFVAAGMITYILYLGKLPALVIIILLTAGILLKNFLSHKKEEREKAAKKVIQREELITVKEVFSETSDHISSVVNRVNKLFSNVVDDLARHDVNNLKKSDKHVNKLNDEIDALKSEAFYFIRSLDDNSVEASRFYLLVLGYLQDISQSISYITKASYKHVNNNHKNLKKSQIKELKSIDTQLSDFLTKVSDIFKNREYGEIGKLVYEKQELLNEVRDNIEAQITRIRTEESSPKNTTLFFGNLLETKDLIKAVMSLLELYQEFDLTMKKEKI
jgi:Na+/phosphate symporter